MRSDLLDFLVLGIVDEHLPVLGIGRALNGVPVGSIVFLPEDSQVLEVLGLTQVDLQPFPLATARSAPTRAGFSVNGVCGKIIFIFFFRAGGDCSTGYRALRDRRYGFTFFFDWGAGLLLSENVSFFG